jgi:hypothetical protein
MCSCFNWAHCIDCITRCTTFVINAFSMVWSLTIMRLFIATGTSFVGASTAGQWALD